jgi:hypothetical protein
LLFEYLQVQSQSQPTDQAAKLYTKTTLPPPPHPPTPSPVPLKIIASSLDSLRSELLQDFTSREDLRESLRVSALVPEIAGSPKLHRGHRWAVAWGAFSHAVRVTAAAMAHPLCKELTNTTWIRNTTPTPQVCGRRGV